MPPALCMGGSDPPGSSPNPWVPSWPRDVAVAPWPRAAQCWLARWDRPGKPGRTPPPPMASDTTRASGPPFPRLGCHWQNPMVSFGGIQSFGDLFEHAVPRTRPRSFHQDLWGQEEAPCSRDASFPPASSLGYWVRISAWGCQSKLASYGAGIPLLSWP